MTKNQIVVAHNQPANRFEVNIDGQMAIAQYTLGKDYIVFTHTEVPEALEGQGIASAMAQTALAFARDNQLQVMPLCAYFATYIRRHPEYRTLLRPGFEV